MVTVELDKLPVTMEVDTGTAYSLISEGTFKELWPSRTLPKSDGRLCSYSGEQIPVLEASLLQSATRPRTLKSHSLRSMELVQAFLGELVGSYPARLEADQSSETDFSAGNPPAA